MADFPETLAATARLQVLSALLMVAGALVAVTLVSRDPRALYSCIPAGMYPSAELERLAESPQARAEFLEHRSIDFGFKSIFSAGLFVHNVQVGLTAFATGILVGAPTVLLVFYNGLTLGAFAWMFSGQTAAAFWAWLLPHAIPELLAVNLCATGGLLLGRAVIVSSREGMAAALRAAARPAFALVVAALPLFALAATIESFIRQSMLSSGMRYAIAGTTALSIAAYVWYVWSLGRRRPGARLDWLLTADRLAAAPGSDSTPAR